jgi:N-acetylmuramoyl-L-alanine amidase
MGESVLTAISRVNKLHKKHVEQAAFLVLKSPEIPSLLIETGFISNPKEARKLKSNSHQQKMAKAIFQGVMAYMQENPPGGSFLAWKKHGGIAKLATHIIVRGDTLSEIASRYRVSFKDLKQVNDLRGNKIRIGQILKIPAS